ncbi:uncharacterized protein PpBr36_10268 [Pyricularia pennisetigena]|uniref:uncharacterized protein n=1 Tax=Pyricularia pennisetigena TaxID=1578925 RepID=UPI001150C0F1|nr:uncharacterized protein PpBr36_10268 [Pyricularia pennisetigena]TLS21516.1 hypothetical protein PpBr36_10268 [Pyricularia pennisetigena]
MDSATEPQPQEPIAIVGTGFRFPGGASTPSKLWDLLRSPRDVLAPIPPTRFNADGFYHPDGEYGGHSNVRHSYTISEDLAAWDASFFNVAAGEASAIDPQQRLLTECVYEALESGGHSVQALRGSDTAVYVGLVNEEYSDVHYRELNTTPRALRSGASRVAVAAGVNMLLGPEPYIVESSFHMLSPTGRCRMWDVSADGYGRGDGVAAVILKKLSQAIADGDRIESVIRETGINQDGATGGITVPNPKAQIALIQDTYRRAGLDLRRRSDRPQFFECHGTGTPTGDPLEARAVHEALGRHVIDDGPGRPPLYVGSIKTVIGHTEATAGIAGLIKASLAIQEGLIPPNLLFEELNPAIEPLYHGLEIPVGKPVPWPATGVSPRRASVNSFGFGGTNAHAIIESYQFPQGTRGAQESDPLPFMFSAATKPSLKRMLAQFADFLSPEQVPQDLTAHDLAFTLNSRRSVLSCRAVFAARGLDDLANKIRDAANDPKWQPTATVSEAKNGGPAPRILGVFAGQGAQWPGMARHVIEDIPFVRRRVAELEGYLQDLPAEHVPSWSLRDELTKVQGSNLDLAQFSQPLCTALQIIQVDLLAAGGVRFSAVVGHSSGEIAAAYAAGLLSARDAMVVAYYRGLHSSRLAGKKQNGGAMMAAGISFAEAGSLVGLTQFRGRIAVAAHNSPTSVTLSGDEDAILEAKELLVADGKFARLLRVDQAYHSHHMRPCLAPYVASLQGAGVGAARPAPQDGSRGTTWYSSVHKGTAGQQQVMTEVDCEYWATNMAQTVLFAGAVESAVTAQASALHPFTMAVGLGPHGALRGPFEDILASLSAATGGGTSTGRLQIPYTDVLTRSQDDSICLMRCMGTLLAHGAADGTDVGRFQSVVYRLDSEGKRPRPARNLPSYPWDHSRTFWHESRRSRALRTRSKPAHPLLGTLSPESSETDLAWHNLLRLVDLPWLRGHRLQGQVIYPAAAYVAAAIDAALHVAGEMNRDVKAIEFRDVWVGKAIVFDDDSASGGVEVYTTLTINRDRLDGVDGNAVLEARFRVRSCLFGTTSTDAALNCSGSVLITMFDQQETGQDRPLLCPQQPPPALLVPVDEEGFYQELNQIGYQYTDFFRAVTSARRKLGYAQAGLNLPTPDLLHRSEKDFLLHPGPLDALFQAILLAYSCPGDGRLWSLHVPIAIERIVMDVEAVRKTKPATTRYAIEATITRDPSFSGQPQKGLGGDVGIFTPDGSSGLVRAEGVLLAPLATAAADDDVQMFLEPVEGAIFTDCTLAMTLADGTTVARATDEETKLGWLLDRIAHFYLKRLADEITPDQEAKAKWHHRKLMDYARHVSREVAAGRQPYVKAEHSQDTYETVRELMDRHMDVIDVQLMRAVGENLGAAVRGETMILQHMMHDGMLDRSYEETLGVKPFSEFLSRVVEQITFVHPDASILEIGAGTGGATKRILDRIPDRFGHYTFTDVSSGFFDKARSVFSGFVESGRMSFRTLDIERDPVEEQGFREQAHDVVLASFVLHATADLESTLRNARRLLRPGGFLVLLEMTSNDTLRLGLTMGGLEGWWLGAESGRPWSPCVSSAEWHRLLMLTGFTGVQDKTPELDLLPWPYGVLVSRAVDDDLRLLLEPSAQAPSELSSMSSLLIVAGSSPQNVALAEELRRMLQPFSASQVVVTDGLGGFMRRAQSEQPLFSPRKNGGSRETGDHADGSRLTVLYLADLDEQPLLQDIRQDAFHGLKELLRRSPDHILWLTHGARNGRRPYALASVGLGRALIMEYRQVAIQFIDFPTTAPDAKAVMDHLLRLVVHSALERQNTNLLWSREPELAVDQQGRLLVSRIQPHRHFNHAYNSARRLISEPADPAGDYEVYDDWDEEEGEFTSRFLLRAQAAPRSFDRPGAHEISPLYSVPLALQPGGCTWNISAGLPVQSAESAERSIEMVLSDRMGSVITALSGPVSISRDATPSRLRDVAAHVLASLIASEAGRDSRPIKHGYQQKSKRTFLVLEPDATLARLLGRAATQSGSWTIVCATTSPEKVASAPDSFAFVDMHASCSVIKKALGLSASSNVQGIFVCSDPTASTSGGQTLSSFLQGSQPELARARTRLIADLLRDAHVLQSVSHGESRPGSQSVLDCMLHDAVMAHAQKLKDTPSHGQGQGSVHLLSLQEYLEKSRRSTPTGLSVIDWTARSPTPLTATARPLDGVRPLLRGDRTYLLLGLGGKGGLGSSLAEYMVGQGARYIVLTSRNPGVEQELIASYAKRGVRIEGIANDITDKSSLEKLIKDLGESPDWPPIAGVANGAMVLADVSLENMTYDQMVRVLRPKVLGSILLDGIFDSVPLDFFVLISSLSCVLGNRGQANYDAANMFLVGLAAQRRARGLAASVVDIGAVMGTGYMAREVKEQTLKQMVGAGFAKMSERDFCMAFAHGILAGRPGQALGGHEVVTGLNVPPPTAEFQPDWVSNPRFSHMVARSRAVARRKAQDPVSEKQAEKTRDLLKRSRTVGDLARIVSAAVFKKMIYMLQVGDEVAGDLDAFSTRSTSSLGVDSLVAVELRTWVFREFEVDMPVFKILADTSFGDVVDFILAALPESLTPSLDKDSNEDAVPASALKEPKPAEPPVKKPSRNSGEEQELEDDEEEEEEPMKNSCSPSSSGGQATPASTTEMSASTPDISLKQALLEENVEQDKIGLDSSIARYPTQESTPEARFEKTIDMSYGQKRFWLMSNLSPTPTVCNVVNDIEIRAELDTAALARAVGLLGARHEALRTAFIRTSPTLDVPQQVILKRSTLQLETREVGTGDEIDKLYRELHHQHFNLETGELVRMVLVSLSPKLHHLLIAYHHINMDSFSMAILVKELLQLYSGEVIDPPAVQQPDLALYEQNQQVQGKQWADELAFWSRLFAENPTFHEPLPILHASPSSTSRARPERIAYKAHVESRRVSAATAQCMRSLCRDAGVTPFHVYTAALQVLVSRLADVQHVTMGMADGNRGSLHLPGAEAAVGNFLNMVPLLLRTPPRDTRLYKLLSETRAVVLAAMGNASVPIELVMEEVNTPKSSSYSPLFQVFIDYKRVTEKLPFPGRKGWVQGKRYLLSKTPYDIMLDVIDTPAGDALLQLHAQQGLYTAEETARLLELYSTLLDSFSQANSQTVVGDARMVAAAEAEAALRLGRGLILNLEHQSILPRLDHAAKSLQDTVALADTNDNTLSWTEMTGKSIALSHELSRLGVGPGSRVGLFQEPTVDWVVTMLGIWRAGASYVPLDLSQGLPRLARIAKAANFAVVVVHHATAALVGELGSRPDGHVVDISTLDTVPPPAAALDKASGLDIKSSQEAMLLYTSGTTGEPKGISIPHRVVVNGIEGMMQRWPELTSEPLTVLQHCSISFDVSWWTVLLGLACRGKAVVASRDIRGDPRALTRTIVQRGIRLTVATPSETIAWLQSDDSGELASCNWHWHVAVGEPIPLTFLRQIHLHGKPSLRVINAYGPSEVWMPLSHEISFQQARTAEDVERLWPVPVGNLMPNYTVRVVDVDGHILPPGMPGHLVIGGCGVALGYVGSGPTDLRFLPDPYPVREHLVSGWDKVHLSGDYGYMDENGVFFSLGRIRGDTQIKLRGMRLDLRHVEGAIMDRAGGSVVEVVVSVRRTDGRPLGPGTLADESTSKVLVAHAVVAPSTSTDSAVQLLRSIAKSLPLPDYMRPAVIVPVKSLPLTPNGKQDRTTIASWPVQLGSRTVPESSAVEPVSPHAHVPEADKQALEQMGRIWQDALGAPSTDSDLLEPLDPEADFFQMGGNSILLTRVQRSIRVEHGVDVPLRELFHNTTLAQMSRFLRQDKNGPSGSRIDWDAETRPLPELDLALRVTEISPAEPNGTLEGGVVVALTGAAGFLGRHLVQSLIRHPAVSEIHCVAVRSRPERLAAHAKAARAGGKKLQIHTGDLSQPDLGIADPDLASSVFSAADVIIHNAADTSFLKSYATLRAANLDSLKALARLSLVHRTIAPPPGSVRRRRPAHIHFVSTAGVATFLGRDLAQEPLGRHPPAHVAEGYLLTKWAGELFLDRMAAASAGLLRATVHRTASLVGPGAPELDVVSSVVRYSIALGAVPTLEGYAGKIQFVPVEEVAEDMVGAAVAADGAEGVRYRHHCGGADAAVDLADLGTYCMRTLGRRGSLPVLGDDEWIDKAEAVGFPPLLGTYLRSDTLGGKRKTFKVLLKD